MIVPETVPLFPWDRLEDQPSLHTIKELLAVVPDAELLERLSQYRGRGRNDYPVRVLWGVELLTVALRHVSTTACLAELRRNEGLRRLIGIESEAGVPKDCNQSRFRMVLGHEPFRTLMHNAFAVLAHRLGASVCDLGTHLAGDSTSLNARRAPGAAADAGLPPAAGGRKEYSDEAGNVVRVHEWHGFKLHLAVCARHEVALAWQVTPANVADVTVLPTLAAQARAVLPAGRVRTLAYDKAADSEEAHAELERAHIKPLIQMRALWKHELERVLPGSERLPCHPVHDEAGSVFCYDMTRDPPVRHPMAFMGHEAARGTLKYRCPAVHQGWSCPSQKRCNTDRPWGLIVRVKQEIDLRRFPAIPRATKTFERLYNGRTAVERVNARTKVFWGADDGNIVGAARFHARVAVVMLVHLAFATLLARAPRRDTLGTLRLGPVQRALATAGPPAA